MEKTNTSGRFFSLPHCKALYLIGLISHLLLTGLMIAWYGWLAPADYSVVLAMCLWVVPLLLPLPGMLRARPYTFAWSGFVLMLLLCHGLTVLVISPSVRHLAITEVVLVVTALTSGSLFARFEGRHLGLGIRKKKKKSQKQS